VRRIAIRTCVGCRQTADRAALVRVVVQAGGAVIDAEHRRPGRGAYLHRHPDCIVAAMSGGLARSFRRKLDASGLARLPLGSAGEAEGRAGAAGVEALTALPSEEGRHAPRRSLAAVSAVTYDRNDLESRGQ
jgi:predicted RNA-binding protein YlxR (DUF448 family)